MKSSTFGFGRTLVLMMLPALFIFSPSLLTGQVEDDPNYDRLPQWYFEQAGDQQPRVSSVVTVDDYDNYFLGVDFAEGHISENPQIPQHYFTAYNTNGTHHTENGSTWNTNTPNFGGTIYGDPVTAYDSVGNLYYMNMYGSGSIQGCKVVVSSTNGASWDPAVVAISGVDKCWMAADQTGGPYSNYVYCTMTSNSGGNFSRSVDEGQTFQQMATFSTQGVPGMMVCVGAYGDIQGGAVYVVTNGGSQTASTYTFYRSLDGGASFQQRSSQNWAGYVGTFVGGRHSVENMRTRPYPFIAADNSFGPNRGRLYCVYAKNDPPGSGNKPDIWCRYSDDGGSTWSGAIRVNDDFIPTAHHQWQPAIWCGKSDGKLYVQWMDTRDVPTSDSCYIYATYSDNGGQTFQPNQRISNEPMKINCSTCGGGGTPRYQGDYNGIVSNSGVAIATWGDFRYGTFASFTGYFPDYAFKVAPEELSITYADTIWAHVPSTKLYSGLVVISTTIEQPATGSITYSYPEGSFLSTFPDSIPIVITAENATPGDYLVTISGKGTNGTPVHTRNAFLVVLPPEPPIADFYADTTELCAGSSANFFDNSGNSPTGWFWEFPGGTPDTSTARDPEGIIYAEPGTYNVTLTVTNSAGTDQVTKENYMTINVTPGPPAGSDTAVCQGDPVPDLYAEGENVQWYDDPELTNLLFSGNTFSTGMTEPGSYTYYVIQAIGDCSSGALVITLTIHALPEVGLGEFGTVCSSDTAFLLTGGIPEGGEYSGDGVEDGYFFPSLAGPGNHDITYTYADTNGCNNSDVEPIVVIGSPVVNIGEDQEFCEGTSVTLDAGSGFDSYLWNTGSTEQTIMVTSTGEYWVEVAGEFGCIGYDTALVTMLPLPGATAVIDGPGEVDNFLDPTSVYTAGESSDATSYVWEVEPAEAGAFTGETVNGEIIWNAEFAGMADIFVTAVNDCGQGERSAAYQVNVYSSQGIEENLPGMARIYPNPNSGVFTLEIFSDKNEIVDLTLTNALGEIIYRKENVTVNGSYREVINLSKSASGMLILRVDNGQYFFREKVFIE